MQNDIYMSVPGVGNPVFSKPPLYSDKPVVADNVYHCSAGPNPFFTDES